jgi:Na+(H+)/acetate symporter ActP
MIGALLFVFYQFHPPPLHFNRVESEKIANSEYASDYEKLSLKYQDLYEQKQSDLEGLTSAIRSGDENERSRFGENMNAKEVEMKNVRSEAMVLMKKNDPLAETNDTNYIFLSFVTKYLPAGLIGLLIAVIFSASMSSTASELNALASTTVIDIVKRFSKKERSEKDFLSTSRWITVFWGMYAILVAMFANQLGSLIEAVNKLGSLFYGTILGIFVVAFYFKKVTGSKVFYAALAAEACVLISFWMDLTAFLWLNLIGCVLVVLFAYIFHFSKKYR